MKNILKKITNSYIYFLIVIIQIVLLILIKNTITNLYYTGFQNKGFTDKIIKETTSATYDQYALLMTSSDFNTFDACYQYSKKTNNYTIKKTCDKKSIEDITKKILPMHYLFYEGLQKGYKDVLNIKDYYNIYNVLEGYNDKQKNNTLKEAKQIISKYTDKELTELVIKDIQREYKKLGKDINTIKNAYIKNNFIKLIIYTLLLIILSLYNIYNKKINNNNHKYIEFIGSLLLLIFCFIFMFKVKPILTIILFVIYFLLLSFLKILDKLRKHSDIFNEELSKIEDQIDVDKHTERNYLIKWIVIPIILFIINLIIFNRYTTYHIFTGMDAYNLQLNSLYYFILIYSIFIYRGLFFNFLNYCKEYRPTIKKRKIREMSKVEKTEKKKKKKKKSKK